MSQWAGLGALPMRAHWCTVTFFGKDMNLYKCLVFTWWTSLDTTPVTFAALGCRLSDLSAGEIVLHASCDSAEFLQSGVRRVLWIVLWYYHRAEIAMGSDSPSRRQVWCRLQRGAIFFLECSGGICQPRFRRSLRAGNSSRRIRPGRDARRPGADVVKALLRRDSRSVRALVLDARVHDRGFHEVTLVDMGDIAGPDVSMADLSLLQLQ